MAATRYSPPEVRKPVSSPRPRGRESSKDTLCRNVLIYGHCRYEDQGCAFNHDPNKPIVSQPEVSKKGLSVDSPSFTPATLPAPTGKTIPSQAVNAPSFTPRNQGTPTPGAQSIAQSATLNPSQFKEFKPQSDYASHASSNGTGSEAQMSFDLFSSHSTVTPYANESYFGDNSHVANGAGGYFTGPSGYAANVQPLQHHLYAPVGPHRLEIQPYQRHAHDFFMDEGVREELQRKSEASLQVMPNSSIQLPNVDVYHTLVALDTNHQDSTHQKLLVLGGYPSWVYKAISSKDGKIYCLRRLKGFKLTNPSAMQAVGEWHRVNNGAIVNVHKTFTTSVFGDSSLIFVTDYHPLSKTLIEHHSPGTGRFGSQRSQALVPEQDIWGYVVQIASAMKSIHQANLAVRCMDASKILVTSKNRIRLNACSMLDVVQFNPQRPLAELQQEDFKNFGELILRVATNTLASRTTWTTAQTQALMEQMARSYTIELVDTCKYLLGKQPKDLNEFLRGIHGHTMDVYNSLMHAEDTCTSELRRELENGRIARLLMKLGTINERPEYEGQLAWSELGGRYQLKLFRDYVFHQVDSNGNAVVDLGHILTQLNRLDAGSDQKIRLVSRDESAEWIVTYKELKKEVEAAFGELTKQASSRGGRGF